MKRRGLVLSGLFAGAVLLTAGCIGSGDTVYQSANLGQSGVSATGQGRAFGEPDVAIITVGVQVEQQTVEEAREGAAGAQQSVIDSLRANGVAQEDIQTVQFSVYPQYDYGRPLNNDQPRIVGYVVSNVVTAKVRDIDATGKAIDDVTRAGGNDAIVQGVAFTVDDPKELRAEARRLAVDAAREQAEQLANAAGTSLGDLISISEEGGPMPFERSFAPATGMDMAQTNTPIEPGEIEVTIRVNVVYALQ